VSGTPHERDIGPPGGESDADAIVPLLASKAESLGNQVTGLLPKMENFIGVAVAILVGAVTLGVTQKHPVILVLLPFPLIILFSYLLQSNTEMLSRAGHKLFLEQKVNELLGKRVLLEESDVAAQTLHGRLPFGRLSIMLIQALMVLLLAGSVVLAITRLDVVEDTAGQVGFWLALTAGLGLLTSAALEQSRAYRGGYQAAKAGFEATAPKRTSALVRSAVSD
jgi:hypothetical protein